MDQEIIHNTEESVKHWLCDPQHRKCCKIALIAANTAMLMSVTFGVTMLWMLELRRLTKEQG